MARVGTTPRAVELAEWAAWRWAGPASFFLGVSSPATIVRTLPVPRRRDVGLPERGATERSHGFGLGTTLSEPDATMVRQPPATDLIDLVLSVVDDPAVRARDGSTVVLVPSTGWAERLTARLVRRGYPATGAWAEARAGWPVVVASRAGAWAPVPRLAAAVVLDAHDAAYREESAPTYSAVEVLLERAGREGAPCILVSPVPPVALAAKAGLRTVAPPAHQERAGWPALERVDRRGADPRTGMFSEEFVRLARSVLGDGAALARGPLVCVYNRTGGARLLACRHCGELARCARCGAAAARPRDEEVLRCPRCGETRPVVCVACGRLRMKMLRAGVSRLREELAALLGVEVGEVTGPGTGAGTGANDPVLPAAPVLVGTEAVLHRVRRAAAVAFLDIDLHLLAPRLSATEDTLALFVRACSADRGPRRRAAVGAGAGPDQSARAPGAHRRRGRRTRRRAGGGCCTASCVVVAAVLRAGAGVWRAGTHLRRGVDPGQRVVRGTAGRSRFRHWTMAGTSSRPRPTAPCVTSWPGPAAARTGSAGRGGPHHALSRTCRAAGGR